MILKEYINTAKMGANNLKSLGGNTVPVQVRPRAPVDSWSNNSYIRSISSYIPFWPV